MVLSLPAAVRLVLIVVVTLLVAWVVVLVESVTTDQLVQIAVHFIVRAFAQVPAFLVSALLSALARLRRVERSLVSVFIRCF